MVQAHLSDHNLMLLLQESVDGGRFVPRLQRKLAFKNKDKPPLEEERRHLLHCNQCLYDIWDAYVSFETLSHSKKPGILPKLLLQLDEFKSAFQIQWRDGFLITTDSQFAVSVRSDQSSSYLTRVHHIFLVPEYKNLRVDLKVESAPHGLKFNFTLSDQQTGPFILSMSYNRKLAESHNLFSNNECITFFVEYSQFLKRSKLLFAIKKEGDTRSCSILEIQS